VKAEYLGDARYVRGLEARLPAGAMIFQMPYRSFPESRPLHQMPDYDQLRPYFHSRSLRWSYPTMRGRPGDAWLARLSQREPPALVADLSDAGFEGLLVDRLGYPDDTFERTFERLLATPALASDDGHWAFFALGGFNERRRRGQSAQERAERRDRALHPLLLRWGVGFYEPEQLPGRTFRWCRGTGELHLDNGSRGDRWASVVMTLAMGRGASALEVSGDLLTETISVGEVGVPVARRLRVPPGDHLIRLRSGAAPLEAPGDPRVLVWRVENLVVDEIVQ
jgi:phosphoglycerol transferase